MSGSWESSELIVKPRPKLSVVVDEGLGSCDVLVDFKYSVASLWQSHNLHMRLRWPKVYLSASSF